MCVQAPVWVLARAQKDSAKKQRKKTPPDTSTQDAPGGVNLSVGGRSALYELLATGY